MQEYIQNVRRELAAFRDHQFITEPMVEVQQQLDRFYHAYNIQTANIGNCLVYRVRVCDGDKPHLASHEIWVPPTEVLKSIGRVNDIGQRIFYGALHPFTAIKEARITAGQYFSMGVYHLKAIDDYDMTSVVIKTPPQPSPSRPLFEQLAHEISIFVVSEFTKFVEFGQEHHYKKSCAMSQTLLSLPNKDSLLYPSLQDANMINLALPEAAAAERLTLQSVLHCQMRTEPYALLESRPTKEGDHLHTVVDKSPDGYKFKLLGEQMNFSETFHHSKIAASERMISHFMAKD